MSIELAPSKDGLKQKLSNKRKSSMSSGEKFLPKTLRAKTHEVTLKKGILLDFIEEWLHRLNYAKPSEDITKLVVDLPENIPVKYTIKKGG